jgi:ATP-dependent Clp protease ATP-binding subunit ClpB
LGAENIQSIATIQLNRLRARLLSMEMNLEFSKEAVKQIAQAGFDSIYGARPLKRAIQSEIENPLAKKILNGDFSSNDNIQIGFEKNKFTFEKI